MPSGKTTDLRSAQMAATLATLTILAVCGPHALAQTNDQVTWGTFRIERNAAPGTYITFEPPLTSITPYTIRWGATGPSSNYVFVGTLVAPDSVVLEGELSSQYILELVSSGQLNIRRSSLALAPGSPQATPGYVAHDFQGARTSSDQTASGDRSVILGGASNRADGSKAAVGGGLGNRTSSTNDVIAGGSGNYVSSSDGAILGGGNNYINQNDAVIIGGYDNSANANRGVLLGGTDNSITANQAFIGGGSSNSNSGDNGTLFGGYDNTTSGTHCVLIGGWMNTVSSTNEATLFGGQNNSINGNHVFVGGGFTNTANSGQCVIFGGSNMSVAGNQCVGLGGQQNQTNGSQNTVLGGQTHTFSSSGQMSIGGGNTNQTQANYTTVNGGRTNTVQQQYSTIMGGRNGTLNAQNSLMFSGESSSTLTVTTTATATFTNVDIWLANNDGTPRQFRFWESSGSSGSYPGATTNYVAIVAPSATNSNLDNSYTLPDRIQTSGLRALAIASSPAPTSTSATLEWVTAPVYTVTTVNATGATTNLSAANLNVDQPVKINPNSTPANRRVTLANGTTDGRVVTIYVYNGTAGNGIRIQGTDTNLALQGGANVDLDQNDSISLIWDNTSTKWIEIGRSVN